MLVKEMYFQVAEYPVGIESHVKVMKSRLDIKKKDNTYMVGIVGTGGIGKTTLAKAIYNSIASQFEGSCFLENVRETSGQKDGLIHLQNKLLSKILGGSNHMVDNVDQGVTLIKKRLPLKRILLVIDDVDKSIQLDKLAGKTDWFGLGSRIIITTRDKHFAHNRVESIYLVNELDHDEALRLFSLNAFKSDKPNDDYVGVTEDAIRYCGGLPLALTVLGSALKNRKISYWKSKLDEYRRIPNSDIQEILKISFDGLDENAKNIFLHIACFFNGNDVEYVRKMLDGCGFNSNTGIDELKDKCLITEKYCTWFRMHDLLQEMGREIVRQESPEEPGERSRLWFHDDVRYVLEENTGTNKVKGILIDLPPGLIHLSPKAFEKMTSLRLLICRNACLFEESNFLSNELRLIEWVGYPGEYFPPNFRGKKLVILRMALSRIKILEGVECFQNLTTMTFFECRFLEKIPDVSRTPNLESLELFCCENLVEVHHSVGLLNKLVKLSIMFCSNLRSFPKRFKLGSLKYLNFSGCSMLKNFPEIECRMECLEDICCKYTGIEELPSSVDNLVGLQILRLGNFSDHFDIWHSLEAVPSFLPSSDRMHELILNCCTNLTNFSQSNFLRALGCRSTLAYLDLSGSGIITLPRCIESFVGLMSLSLDECKQLREIQGLPANVKMMSACWCVSLEIFLEGSRRSQLFNTEDPPEPVGVGTEILAQQSLRELYLSGCSAIVSLPTFFNRFVRLNRLALGGCKQLREVPELPRNIVDVDLGGCRSLEIFTFNHIHDLSKLHWIDFSHCPEQIRNAVHNHLFSEGQPKLFLFKCIYPGNRIPDCFSYCKEVSNTHLCEIDTGPIHLDSENATFAFFAVIGTRDDGKDESIFYIDVQVINNGQQIRFDSSDSPIGICQSVRSDHVWLYYKHSRHFQLKTDNLRVQFKIMVLPPLEIKYSLLSVFFKSCGFHIIEYGYDDDERHSLHFCSKRRRNEDDEEDGTGTHNN